MSRLSISSSFLVYCHLRCSLDGNLVKYARVTLRWKDHEECSKRVVGRCKGMDRAELERDLEQARGHAMWPGENVSVVRIWHSRFKKIVLCAQTLHGD